MILATITTIDRSSGAEPGDRDNPRSGANLLAVYLPCNNDVVSLVAARPSFRAGVATSSPPNLPCDAPQDAHFLLVEGLLAPHSNRPSLITRSPWSPSEESDLCEHAAQIGERFGLRSGNRRLNPDRPGRGAARFARLYGLAAGRAATRRDSTTQGRWARSQATRTSLAVGTKARRWKCASSSLLSSAILGTQKRGRPPTRAPRAPAGAGLVEHVADLVQVDAPGPLARGRPDHEDGRARRRPRTWLLLDETRREWAACTAVRSASSRSKSPPTTTSSPAPMLLDRPTGAQHWPPVSAQKHHANPLAYVAPGGAGGRIPGRGGSIRQVRAGRRLRSARASRAVWASLLGRGSARSRAQGRGCRERQRVSSSVRRVVWRSASASRERNCSKRSSAELPYDTGGGGGVAEPDSGGKRCFAVVGVSPSLFASADAARPAPSTRRSETGSAGRLGGGSKGPAGASGAAAGAAGNLVSRIGLLSAFCRSGGTLGALEPTAFGVLDVEPARSYSEKTRQILRQRRCRRSRKLDLLFCIKTPGNA